MANIQKILKDYGLDDKEAALYLASLELGETHMARLAKRAGLKRTSAYLIFKALEVRGLMASFKMRSGLRFVGTRPEALINKTKRQLEELESVLPELKAIIQKEGLKPKLYYYEGKEGYLVATEDSLKTTGAIVRHIGALAEIHDVIGFDYDAQHYIPTRVKQRIFFKALYFESETEDEIKNRSHAAELREIRYLPEQYHYQTSTLIYGDKIAIFSTRKELITVIIESKEIAESERKKFDLIWDLVGK
jgi:HTH-type transcriptional regulator, sugar sensing transcriptional regulator